MLAFFIFVLPYTVILIWLASVYVLYVLYELCQRPHKKIETGSMQIKYVLWRHYLHLVLIWIAVCSSSLLVH
jgi:hypothetical protein